MFKSWFKRFIYKLVLVALRWLQEVALELQPVLREGCTPLQEVKNPKYLFRFRIHFIKTLSSSKSHKKT